MNIHEYQAKEILKKFGAPTLNGVVVFNNKNLKKKIKKLKSKKLIVKAQIHAGGRGKAGGIKVAKNFNELEKIVNNMIGKVLITHQTGPEGKKVARVYIEESCEVLKEFYLSCLVDRDSSKIAFISSSEGGVNIEEIAKKNPKKITSVRMKLSKSVSKVNIKKIIKPFNLPSKLKKKGFKNNSGDL